MDARTAFLERVRKMFPTAEPSTLREIDAAAHVVPGFTTFEVIAGGHPARGWARDDGTVVLARGRQLGPVLDALRDQPAAALAERLVWGRGDGYELVADVAPVRETEPDGAEVVRFHVRVLPDGDEPGAIVEHRIARKPDGTCRLDVTQIDPAPEDEA